MSESYKNSGVALFKSDNKLYDMEKARESVRKSLPSVGLRYDDGVVLISYVWDTESNLLDKSGIRKVRKLTDEVGATFSGKVSDGQQIMTKLQDSVLEDYDNFDKTNDVDYHTKQISSDMEDKSLQRTTRIFGVELLVGGFDNRSQPCLYHVDPDGSMTCWYAYAVGRNQNSIIEYLEDKYNENIDKSEAIRIGLNGLLKNLDRANIEPKDFQGCYINNKGYDEINNSRIQKVISDQK